MGIHKEVKWTHKANWWKPRQATKNLVQCWHPSTSLSWVISPGFKSFLYIKASICSLNLWQDSMDTGHIFRDLFFGSFYCLNLHSCVTNYISGLCIHFTPGKKGNFILTWCMLYMKIVIPHPLSLECSFPIWRG